MKNKLGIVSIVLGAISIPCMCSFLGVIPALIGLILGIIAFKRGEGKEAIVGIIVSVVGFVCGAIVVGVLVYEIGTEIKLDNYISSGEYEAAEKLIQDHNFGKADSAKWYYKLYVAQEKYDEAAEKIIECAEKYDDMAEFPDYLVDYLDDVVDQVSESNQKRIGEVKEQKAEAIAKIEEEKRLKEEAKRLKEEEKQRQKEEKKKEKEEAKRLAEEAERLEKEEEQRQQEEKRIQEEEKKQAEIEAQKKAAEEERAEKKKQQEAIEKEQIKTVQTAIKQCLSEEITHSEYEKLIKDYDEDLIYKQLILYMQKNYKKDTLDLTKAYEMQKCIELYCVADEKKNQNHKKFLDSLMKKCNDYLEPAEFMLHNVAYMDSLERGSFYPTELYLRRRIDSWLSDLIEGKMYYYANNYVYDEWGLNWGDEEYVIETEEAFSDDGYIYFWIYNTGTTMRIKTDAGFERDVPVYRYFTTEQVDQLKRDYKQAETKSSKIAGELIDMLNKG